MITRNNIGARAVEKKDLETLKDWRNIPNFRKNFREVRELNNDNQEKWFDKTNNSPNDYMFLFEDIENKTPVGAGGLLYINWIIRSADFSFYIGHNQGYVEDKYAINAATLLIEYGFNNLNLKEKFHFKIDGKLRDNCFEEGRYWDSLILSLTSNDFKNGTK